MGIVNPFQPFHVLRRQGEAQDFEGKDFEDGRADPVFLLAARTREALSFRL